jgi:hypothetical protein
MIAEQRGQKIGAQYLRGGSKQAMLKLPEEIATALGEAAAAVEKSGYEVVTAGGVRWELRRTGWSDVNGIHGYVQPPGPGSVQVERLPSSTVVGKIESE